MNDLINLIENLKKSEVKTIIDNRIKEFNSLKKKSINEIFKELCFCIMTANCAAKKCMDVQERIGNGFLELSEPQLASKLRKYGYRFPNIRAKYIVGAKNYLDKLKSNLNNNLKGDDLRDWIVSNIKGLGYKEASHFLRNIGYIDFAIIDFHIINLLSKNKIVEKPKTLTKKKYLEIEYQLKLIGQRLKLNLAELDLYLWYLETGTVLK